MKSEEPLYSVLVLFGKEHPRSVATADLLDGLIADIIEVVKPTGCKLVVRGTVQGEMGKKLAPRKGPWSPAMRDRWKATLDRGEGRFLGIQLFDATWRSGHHPDAFASVHKFWGFGIGAYKSRSNEGPGNNLTIAIRDDLVPGAFERLRTVARPLCEKIACFYGAIESSVPWDRPVGRMFEDMIDIRWYNRTSGDYSNGKYKLENMVARLNRGNILCHSQFINQGTEQLANLPGVARVEQWPLGLTYLELTEQPAYEAKPSPAFEGYIRFVPEAAKTKGRTIATP